MGNRKPDKWWLKLGNDTFSLELLQKMSGSKWSTTGLVAQRHHPSASQLLSAIYWLLPRSVLPHGGNIAVRVYTSCLHSRQKAPESHKPRLPLEPLVCGHSPPFSYIVSVTAKQFGRAGIFIWQFCLNYCVIIFLLEGPLVCSCKFWSPVHPRISEILCGNPTAIASFVLLGTYRLVLVNQLSGTKTTASLSIAENSTVLHLGYLQGGKWLLISQILEQGLKD